jgi:hypothetical protein
VRRSAGSHYANRLAPRQGAAQGAGPLLFLRLEFNLLQTRPGTGSAILRLGPEGTARFPPDNAGRDTPTGACEKSVDATTRNPTLLFRLSGSFLLRFAQRALSALLFQEPPRNTRARSSWSHRRTLCAGAAGTQAVIQPVAFRQPPRSLPISANWLAA